MTTNTHIDYIIVGQGLAGSALALQFLLRKKKILVVDQPSANISSHVAAGLFNPFTGRKMSKTWKADIIFPYLAGFYRQAEDFTGADFFYPMPVYRPFLSVEEQNEWMGASSDPSLANFIERIVTTSTYGSLINDPFGGLLLKHSGFLDTVKYIKALQSKLADLGAFVEEMLDVNSLIAGNQYVQYKNWLAGGIIFCEGVNIFANELFNWVPIRGLKGEAITIRAPLGHGTIFNRGVYIVPGEGRDVWRVGATYAHGNLEHGTSLQGRAEIEARLGEIIKVPYEVIDHQWGIRPTTPDRRPVMGTHPVHKNFIFFNGFGTKGVSLTPYFSEVLINWLENKSGIDQEVNINRYKSLY